MELNWSTVTQLCPFQSEHERRQNHPRQLSISSTALATERLHLSGTRKTITIIEWYHHGSAHHARSVNDQKITSSKEYDRPYDSPDYLVKTSKCEFFHFFWITLVLLNAQSLFICNCKYRVSSSLNQQVFEKCSVFKTPEFVSTSHFSHSAHSFLWSVFSPIFVLHCFRRPPRSGHFYLLGNALNIINQSFNSSGFGRFLRWIRVSSSRARVPACQQGWVPTRRRVRTRSYATVDPICFTQNFEQLLTKNLR